MRKRWRESGCKVAMWGKMWYICNVIVILCALLIIFLINRNHFFLIQHVLCGEEFFQEVIWMIKESFLLFISAIVWNSLLLRCGIEDAFLFKKTHREEKSYYALLSRSPRFRILLPYREMIPCYAPRHMRFFQIARKVNLTVLAVAGIICILSWNNRALEVFGYVFMGCYFFIYIIPFFIYTIYMKNAPGKPKGFDFSKSHNP